MANEFLVAKWKVWFKSLDVNKDGVISKEDLEESKANFCKLHHLDPAKAQQINSKFDLWWTKYVFRGNTGEISESLFVETLCKDYAGDKSKFQAESVECFNFIFDVVDTNKDRSISEEELLITFKAYGHDKAAQTTEQHSLFEKLGPQNGLVPIQHVVEVWAQFLNNDDSSTPDILKEALEHGA